MGDIKLFRLASGQAVELQGDASDLEKPLQTLIEANLGPLLGIRFLVFYLDWLMDHQAEFKLLVMDRLGKPAADAIDWTAPRLVCIAADFTRYDGHAVQQINRNIELIRYRRFGDELLLLELANAASAPAAKAAGAKPAKAAKVPSTPVAEPAHSKAAGGDRTYADGLAMLPPHLGELLASLEGHVLSLGDDVQRKELKLYLAFKRLKNFATVVPQKNRLLLYLHLNPARVAPLPTNAQDVSEKGHWGTGDLELSLTAQADLDAAKPLILMAYEGRAPGLADAGPGSSTRAGLGA
jgi:predicted transport protein